jgi:hypothetical protein
MLQWNWAKDSLAQGRKERVAQQKQMESNSGGAVMISLNYYLALRLAEMRVEDAIREAEVHRLMREAKTDPPGWLFQLAYWLLCQLGRLLVAMGCRLHKIGSPQTIPLTGKRTGGVLSNNRR